MTKRMSFVRDVVVAMAAAIIPLWGLVWLGYHAPDAEWAKVAHDLTVVLLSVLWVASVGVLVAVVIERNS